MSKSSFNFCDLNFDSRVVGVVSQTYIVSITDFIVYECYTFDYEDFLFCCELCSVCYIKLDLLFVIFQC